MKFKKTLVALSALSAFGVMAQADPNAAEFKVSGKLNPGIVNSASVTAKGNTTISTTGKQNWKSGAEFYFSGKTERVDGWAGIYLFELDPNSVDQTMVPGTGEIFGGLNMAGIGELKLGVPNNLTLISQVNRQPFGTKTGSGFSSVLGIAQVRDASSFVFKTENMGGVVIGIQGHADRVTAATVASNNAVPATAKAGGGELGVQYTAKPVYVNLTMRNSGGAYATATSSSSSVSQRVLAVQFDYADTGKLYLGYHDDKMTTDTVFGNGLLLNAAGVQLANTSSGFNLGAKHGVSDKMEVLFNYATKTDKRDAVAGDATDQTIVGLGMNYAHSAKLTSSVRYVQERNTGTGVYTAAGTAVESVRSVGYGLELVF